MNIRSSKPNLDNKETNEKIEALYAYIENIKAEVTVNFSILTTHINKLSKSIDQLKGESQ